MKRSISTLLTTLLFSVALVPNAMAQRQKSGFPSSAFIDAVAIAEQPTAAAINQPEMKTELSPESAQTAATAKAINADSARSSVDNAYPAYCPPLPPGTQPGDWDYREALERCLHGN